MSMLATLRRWEEVKRRRDDLDRDLVELARPLETAAKKRLMDRYAHLLRQDADGRVRFDARGGERTFTIEELDGA